MPKETRTVVYDSDLRIESYRLSGVVQSFPTHFHEYYVIGLVNCGERRLHCMGEEYLLRKGQTVIFNPGESHRCEQVEGSSLDYLGLNISKEAMLDLAKDVTGSRELPGFSKTVIQDEEIVCCLSELHELVMSGSGEFAKEENLLLLLSMLIRKYGQPFENCVLECRTEIERACEFMQENYSRRISLEEICACAGLSKSAMLREFTRTKGVTPYRYLENIRIGQARKLLERGAAPMEAALETGFSDQSHFTNYFSRFIGLSPGAYRDIFLNKK